MKCLNTGSTPSASAQRGFAAVAAVFLVVILAALGGFMLTFSNTQQLSSAQDMLGSRAYWAARGGLDFAVGSISASAGCPASTSKLTLDGFTVCVNCAASAYAEGAKTVTIYTLTSLARMPVLANCTDAGDVGGIGYVERSLSAIIER